MATYTGSKKPQLINVVKPTNLPADWNDNTLTTAIGKKPLAGSITSSHKPLTDEKKTLAFAHPKPLTNCIKTPVKLQKGWEKTMAPGSLNPKMRSIDQPIIS